MLKPMHTAAEIALALKACATRQEAFACIMAQIDDRLDELVRTVAARTVTDDRDIAEITSTILQVRGAVARDRAELLGAVARLFDDVLGPEQ